MCAWLTSAELRKDRGDYEYDEDKLYDDTDEKKTISGKQSYRDYYDDYKASRRRKKKKVYVPVFVSEKEKKKSKFASMPVLF